MSLRRRNATLNSYLGPRFEGRHRTAPAEKSSLLPSLSDVVVDVKQVGNSADEIT